MNADTPPVTGTFLAALARKECKAIAKALGNRKDRHRGIHEARKAIRRLRSLLALVSDAVGHETAKIDIALRNQAKRLSALRDSQVVVAMAEKLAIGDETGEWAIAAQVLAVQRDLLLETELNKDPAFARRTAAIGDIAIVFDKLRWKRVSQKSLQLSIKKSHRRVNKSEHDAAEQGTPASLHRWRRRVRRLRLQLNTIHALNRLAGSKIQTSDTHKSKSAKALARLADQLGWRQDIQVLRAALKTFPDPRILASLRKRLRLETKLARY
ncbi:CHAD domain-containing protein [Rhodanobacter sp. MP1X3]|uniref:CHAD domain-containing protein n=1 Tax=Rhodanobacter sp. MP1X3 TaxID=2723086 RepID=UPI001613AC0E|nr:CHAD domain-containing protein [Rhodanobacter sp. MP1X3]MBB6244550.1 CHAD domain-containing protein [Rhodanobacter sp. MP1X3]